MVIITFMNVIQTERARQMEKHYITFDDYEKIEEELNKIQTNSGVWYPTEEYEQTLADNISVYYKYLIWLTEYTNPISEYEKKRCKALKELLNKHLVLVESQSEIPSKKEITIFDFLSDCGDQEEIEIA